MKKIFRLSIPLMLFLAACCTGPEGYGDEGAAPSPADDIAKAGEWEPSANSIDTLYCIGSGSFPQDGLESDYLCAAASLQGLLNSIHGGNAIYIVRPGEHDWTRGLGARCVVDFGSDFRAFLISALRSSDARSYVLAAPLSGDAEVDGRNAAIAADYATVSRSVILSQALLEAEGEIFGALEMAYDASGKDYQDILSMVGENSLAFSTDALVRCASRDGKGIDAAIAHRWICLDENAPADKFYPLIEPCSPVYSSAPGTEEEIALSSGHGLYLVPAGTANLSTRERGPVFHNDLAVGARKFPVDTEKKSHQVAIVLSGGEDIAAFEDGRLTSFYSSPLYGSVPVTITMSSSLKGLRPVVHNWFQTHTHSSCSICSGIGGAGEVFLSKMDNAAREDYGRLTEALMEKEGQDFLTLTDPFVKTWDKVVASCTPMLRQMKNCEGAVHFDMGSGEGSGAGYAFVNGIPLLRGRYVVGHDGKSFMSSVSECANIIIRCSVEPAEADSYSVVLVPVQGYFTEDGGGADALWEDLGALSECLSGLDDVELVSLAELFGRFSACVDGAGRIN